MKPKAEGFSPQIAASPPGFLYPGFSRDKLSARALSPRDVGRCLVVIVVVIVVVMIVVRVTIITVMIAHRVADGGAADPANDRADWPAHHRSADRASDASGYGAA